MSRLRVGVNKFVYSYTAMVLASRSYFQLQQVYDSNRSEVVDHLHIDLLLVKVIMLSKIVIKTPSKICLLLH